MTTVDRVYFARDERGNIKIGTSRDVLARISQLQTACSGVLELVGLVVGGRDLEQALHARWAQHRQSGEWFWPADEIKDFIAINCQRELDRLKKPSSAARTAAANAHRPKVEIDDLGQRVVAYLRRLHPRRTAENVAAETGCSLAAVRKWIERKAAPSGIPMVQLILAYGPEFVCSVVDDPPVWLLPTEDERKARR